MNRGRPILQTSQSEHGDESRWEYTSCFRYTLSVNLVVTTMDLWLNGRVLALLPEIAGSIPAESTDAESMSGSTYIWRTASRLIFVSVTMKDTESLTAVHQQ